MDLTSNEINHGAEKKETIFPRKITISFKEDERETLAKLESIAVQVNQIKQGKKISVSEVIRYSVKIIQDDKSTISDIVESTMSDWDKINLELEKYNKKNSFSYSLEEFLVMKLKIQKH
jgi:hypothetical protein